jgi:hypothetical protein
MAFDAWTFAVCGAKPIPAPARSLLFKYKCEIQWLLIGPATFESCQQLSTVEIPYSGSHVAAVARTTSRQVSQPLFDHPRFADVDDLTLYGTALC